MENEAQVEILKLRASMGTWKKGTLTIDIKDREITLQEDSRRWTITEGRGSYKQPFVYNANEGTVKSRIRSLKQVGFKLTDMQYPELKAHFRNGEPITKMDELSDSLATIEAKPPVDVWEVLFALYDE